MLHHVPVLVLLDHGLSLFWVCCCGWEPTSGDSSLAVHLRREAVIAKLTRLGCDGLVGHFRGLQEPAHMLDRYHDNDEILIALRSGDWPAVVEMLKEAEDQHGRTSRDSRGPSGTVPGGAD